MNEVCKQLVFTKFSELRFHFFCNVLQMPDSIFEKNQVVILLVAACLLS